MAGSPRRSYRSIGEVLALLQDEFPDVTVSKIRFLEAQGLIQPERTPSGYRRFREHDVERLREVLVLQRDEFLPLRVIRERLHGSEPHVDRGGPQHGGEPAVRSSGALLRREELLRASRLESAALDELLRYGLVQGRVVGGELLFDESAVVIARIATRYADLGLDARHLRSLKVGFDRERLLYDQLLLPLTLRPSDRTTARERRSQLIELGSQLRAALSLDSTGHSPSPRA